MNGMWTVAVVALVAAHASDGYILLVAVAIMAYALAKLSVRGRG